jgi:hypothetical protein
MLSTGAKFMRQRNIAVDKGLVNGSMGYVKGFKSLPNGEIGGITVQFTGKKKYG